MSAVEERQRAPRKERTGVVTSAAADKTIVVLVERRTTHNLYHKTLKRSKKYHAHDERNEAAPGDTVRIAETRPYSKTKRWRLVEIVERAR
jgi:small subunit ribosomal protein S17